MRTAVLAACCLLATAYVFGCVLVLHGLRLDLDPWRATLSQYLVGPGSGWLVAGYMLQAMAMLALAQRLRRWPRPGAMASIQAGSLAVAALGLAAVAAGDVLFPPADTLHPGVHHHLAASLAFTAALASCALHVWRLWSGELPLPLRRTATLLALLCWLLACAHAAGLPGLAHGAGQKLLISCLLLWIAVLAASIGHGRQRGTAGADDAGADEGAGASPSFPTHSMEACNMIQRFDCGPRLAEMTVHNGVAYLAGQIPEDTSADITGQTAQVLADIDALLARAGTSKEHILRAEIFLADINDTPGMNAAWDAWVPAGCAPARATVEARLVNKDWKVEIVVTAAIP